MPFPVRDDVELKGYLHAPRLKYKFWIFFSKVFLWGTILFSLLLFFTVSSSLSSSFAVVFLDFSKVSPG